MIITIAFLYILLPFYIAAVAAHPVKLLFFFYLTNAAILFYLLKRHLRSIYNLNYQTQRLEEKLNLLNDAHAGDIKSNAALKEKISRYNRLREIIEEISQSLDLEAVADSLSAFAFSLISKNRGTCILYLVDIHTQKLGVFKTKKEDSKLVIKAKEGDIFDHWVLRHASPLLVEDIRQDFRFDPEKLKIQDLRQISSMVSAPLISDCQFLGILRLDNPQANFYNQDDLRFLAAICDLGAVAVENSQLFQRAQDLAMHDGLTGLYTKGFFLERLKEECKRSSGQKRKFTLFMLDIDYFKNYNDRFGHTAGDIVLKKLSQILNENLKVHNPLISRFGGEEFCFFLSGADKQISSKVAQGLREKIESEKIILRRLKTNITVSIGLAEFPLDAADETELIQKADRAMYTAKQKGRNRVCAI